MNVSTSFCVSSIVDQAIEVNEYISKYISVILNHMQMGRDIPHCLLCDNARERGVWVSIKPMAQLNRIFNLRSVVVYSLITAVDVKRVFADQHSLLKPVL